jgi:hypothetical protein
VDHLSTHDTPDVQVWMEAHRNAAFHFARSVQLAAPGLGHKRRTVRRDRYRRDILAKLRLYQVSIKRLVQNKLKSREQNHETLAVAHERLDAVEDARQAECQWRGPRGLERAIGSSGGECGEAL